MPIPTRCEHRNLHPGRFDGNRTYCFDCNCQVVIDVFIFDDGTSIMEQCKKAREACDKEYLEDDG